MKIATIGRGNVGSGLAQRWRKAGHEVTEIGSDGGDVSGVEAVLVAIPSNAIEDALTKVTGIGSAVVIDATNAFTGRDEGFESLAHQIKSHVDGPVAKSFNCNYAALYDEIDNQRVEPCNLYAAEDDAVEIMEQLSRDAGYPPDLHGRARQRAHARGAPRPDDGDRRGGTGRFFYRYAPPGEF